METCRSTGRPFPTIPIFRYEASAEQAGLGEQRLFPKENRDVTPCPLPQKWAAHVQVARNPDIRWPIDPPRPIRPWPPIFWPPPFQQVLTVDSVHINAAITGDGAQTEVTQTWRNDTDRVQAGSYLFPLPEGAVVSNIALYDGERKVAAELLNKDQASDTYEGIVRRQRDPALLRYAGRREPPVRQDFTLVRIRQ